MTLTLVIGAGERLSNGAPGELVLHRRGAVVGRAATCDWPLPDPTRHISSRHFEIRYDGRGYLLADCSTNGTVLAATGERLSGAHPISHGDRFQVGPLVIEARLSGKARVDAEPDTAAPPPAWRGWEPQDGGSAPSPAGPASSDWSATPAPAASGWDSVPSPTGASPTAASSAGWDPAPTDGTGWDTPPLPASPRPASPAATPGWAPQASPSLARPDAHRAAAGWDAPAAATPAAGGWAPTAALTPPPAPASPPVSSAWDVARPAPDPASGWSSAAPDRPSAPSPDDLWGRIAEGNVVDWARGGFGQPAEPTRDPLGLAPPLGRESLPPERPRAPPAPPPPSPPAQALVPPPAQSPEPAPLPPVPPATPAPARAPAPGPDRFLSGAGLDPATVGDPATMAEQGGNLFRRLVAGLVVMVEARARAKAQLGAEATAYSPEGHNPLKFARTPDEAVAALLGASRPGFMAPEAAVEDAFRELQQHQVATLKAMQGALQATLERFSPSAIRTRADARGMLERIVPTARDAALWQAYEREFGGVALGSDEAFLDVFAKQFRQAYNEQVTRNR